MNTKKSSKTPYLILALIVIIVVSIYFYWNGTKPSTTGTLEQVNLANQAVGARVLAILNELNSLKIDDSVFKDPAYSTLRDYSVEIPPLPVGRPNPFAPIPGVVTTPTNPTR